MRLVVADLDGTLFPSPLAAKIQHAIRSLRYYRVRFTLATGRTFGGVRELYERLSLPAGTPLVLYNGSVVIEGGTGRILHRVTIPAASIEQVLHRARNYRCEVFGYSCSYPVEVGSDRLGVIEQVFGCRFGSSRTRRAARDFNRNEINWLSPTHLSSIPLPSAVLISADDAAMLDALARDLRAIPEVNVTRSGTVYLELRPAFSNKAAGLATVASCLDVGAEEVLAIGDHDNDAEMLAWAGIGVVISNASVVARQNADYVCRRNTFEGVVEVLNIVRQAKRYFPGRTRKTAIA